MVHQSGGDQASGDTSTGHDDAFPGFDQASIPFVRARSYSTDSQRKALDGPEGGLYTLHDSI
jgi:hypothetical protein